MGMFLGPPGEAVAVVAPTRMGPEPCNATGGAICMDASTPATKPVLGATALATFPTEDLEVVGTSSVLARLAGGLVVALLLLSA